MYKLTTDVPLISQHFPSLRHLLAAAGYRKVEGRGKWMGYADTSYTESRGEETKSEALTVLSCRKATIKTLNEEIKIKLMRRYSGDHRCSAFSPS